MKTRACLVALAALLLVIALPRAALAKGPSGATIAGPGMSPIQVGDSGGGEPGSGTDLAVLADETGFFPALFGQEPDPMLQTRPAGMRGSRYEVAYSIPSNDGNDIVKQDVYPLADGGPLVYTQAGQPFFDGQTSRGGWFRAPPALVQTLRKLGVPLAPGAAAPATSDRPGSAAPVNPVPATADGGSAPMLPILVVGALCAAVGTAVLGRWRPRRRAQLADDATAGGSGAP
jgi:hypothetical protein